MVEHTLSEAAKILGISRPTALKYVRAGLLKATKMPNGHLAVTPVALQAFSSWYTTESPHLLQAPVLAESPSGTHFSLLAELLEISSRLQAVIAAIAK